ncbi:MAG: hypothetical protein ACFE8P_03340, partial [Promethearchaeota archaeon]
DGTFYPSWVNVPEIVSVLAFGLDREYYFGNFIYSTMATFDPFFEFKEESTLKRIVRAFNNPLRSLLFERVRKGDIDMKMSKKLYKKFMGTKKLEDLPLI